MSLFYKAKKLDFSSGSRYVVLLNRKDAFHSNIRPGDKISISWPGQSKIVVITNITKNRVKIGEIGLNQDIWQKHKVKNQEIIESHFLGRPKSILAIRKKLLNQKLTQEDIDSIITDIVSGKIGHTEIAYFVASGFIKDYSNEELYFLAKSIAE
ncbi:hypothetical protein HQ544_00970, partial [Candidatus Falkowbacteria bacterium]|nr:hypothetical protein [Candidatus Falkowbacteria bacterium]